MKTTKKPLLVILSGLAIAALMVTPAQASGFVSPPEPKATGSAVANTAMQQAASDAVQDFVEVEQNAQIDHAEVFGGMAYENGGESVTAYVTEKDPELVDLIEDGLKESFDEVQFELTPNSAAELADLHGEITNSVNSLVSQGIQIDAFFPDMRTGMETIEVVNLSPEEDAQLRAQFEGKVNVVSIEASEQAVFLDRQNDYAPWNGGDFITNGRGDCTSGIPVHNPGGARYLVTAGHCFAVGEVIRNKSVRIPLGTNNIIGPVAVRDFLTPYSLDAELINTNSSPYTWRGGTAGQSPTTKSFAGALTSPIGAPVCHSGAFEGDRCFTIQQNGITKQIEGYWLSSLVRATGSDPQAVGQGDSGGPVVRMIGNSMYGVGTVTAGEGVWTTCSNWSPQTSRKCYPTLLYTDLGPTLTKWGISVN